MTTRLKICTLAILLFSFGHSHAQIIDTLRLKKEVESLIDYDSKLRFLTKIEAEDQAFRGKQTNDSLDLEHLISMAYFVNKFGYPTAKTFGEPACAAWLTWIHQKYRKIDLLSSSIIVKGFLAGELQPKDLKTYYFYQFYHYKFDDSLHLEMPMKVFFDSIGVDTKGPVSIEKIMEEVERNKEFDATKRVSLGTWKTPPKEVIYNLNGQPIKKVFNRSPVQIFTFRDRRIFFYQIFADDSFEPKELIKIGDKKYKFKHQQTDKYFEIDEAGNLYYRNATTVFETYLNTNPSR